MQIRNALIVLNNVQSVFPVFRIIGENLVMKVEELSRDHRKDITMMAERCALIGYFYFC